MIDFLIGSIGCLALVLSWIRLDHLLENRSLFFRLSFAYLFLSGWIILSTLGASLFSILNAKGVTCMELLLAAGIFSFVNWRKTKALSNPAQDAENTLPRFSFLILPLIFLVPYLLINLWIPTGIQDSHTYHLPRIGFWLQNQNLLPWDTTDLRETSFNINQSLFYLWIFLKTGHSALFPLVSFCSTAVIYIALVQIARDLKVSQFASIVLGCLWLFSPMAFLMSSTTQNETIIGAELFIFAYFGFRYLKHGDLAYLCLAALGIGLAAGTKISVAFYFFSILLIFASTLFSVSFSLWRKRLYSLSLGSLLSFFLFGSYIYIQNEIVYGSPIGRIEEHSAGGKDFVAATGVNFIRYAYQFVDTSAAPFGMRNTLERTKFATAHHLLHPLTENLLSRRYVMGNQPGFDRRFSPNINFYKELHPSRVMGGYLYSCVAFVPLIGLLWKPRSFLPFIFLGVLLFAVLSMSAMIGYGPFNQRYLYAGLAASYLALIPVFRRPGFPWLPLLLLIPSLCMGIQAFCDNSYRPLLGDRNIFTLDTAQRITRRFSINEEMVRCLQEMDPHASIAILTEGWAGPFFGENFTRKVTRLTEHFTPDDPSLKADFLFISNAFPEKQTAIHDNSDTWELYSQTTNGAFFRFLNRSNS